MDAVDRLAEALGMKVIRDPNCPPGRIFFVSKKVLDEFVKELPNRPQAQF